MDPHPRAPRLAGAVSPAPPVRPLPTKTGIEKRPCLRSSPVDRRIKIGLGALLLVAGLLYGLLNVGVLALADCGPDCQARAERVVVVMLLVVSLAVAGVGAWLMRSGWRARA